MNAFDILIGLLIVWAIVVGLRRGFVRQLCGIAGVVLGVWLAFRFGATVGEWLSGSGQGAKIAGFVTVVVVTMIAGATLGWLLSRLVRISGLGMLDRLGGALLSTAKMLLAVSALLVCFEAVDSRWELVKPETKGNSTLYRPVMKLSCAIFPAAERARKKF
ncbi:MAG: CvpA family protein [Rikenellaceae bacterium]|jgi:membrane protein required for colicin V production|nr:CvpA family protein [Rikenellaceae bacterium]